MSLPASLAMLALVLALAAAPSGALAGSPVITPGRGIGRVTLRMTARQVYAVLGPPATTAYTRGQLLLRYPVGGLTVWIAKDRVIRIRTVHPDHRTAAGFGPGDGRWEQARQALCHGGRSEASATRPTAAGFEIRCPLRGVILEVSQDRLASVSVIPIERLRPRRTLR
jgi:hypothetical protein